MRASKSTSRQRSPSSSPWRSPVIAAVKYSVGSIRAERIVGVRRGEQLLELGLVEELDPRLGLLDRRPVGELDRVRLAPALPQPQVEDRVHRVDVVADRLDRERPALRGHVALDVLRPHPVERLAGEERRDVVAQIGGDRQPVRLAPALQLEPLAELAARLLHRDPLGVRRRARRVDLAHPAQHSLGLRLREPVSARLGATSPDLALNAPAVRPVPRADPGAADHPQRARSVGAPARFRSYRHRCGSPSPDWYMIGTRRIGAPRGRAVRSMYRSCTILTGSYLIERTEKPSKLGDSDPSQTSQFRLGAGRSQVQILSPRLSKVLEICKRPIYWAS